MRSGLYLLLTSNDVVVQDFSGQVCGYHYFTLPSVVGYTLPFAWVGNSQKLCLGVCAYPFVISDYIPGLKPLKTSNGDMGVDGMVSVIGHEIAELATNPFLNAWYGSRHGQDPSLKLEIVDLCEGIYGTSGGGSYTEQLLNGEDGAAFNKNGIRRRFLVQWVWNRVVNYCSGIRIAIPIPLVTGASLQKITLHIKLDNDDYNKKCLLHQVLIQKKNIYIYI